MRIPRCEYPKQPCICGDTEALMKATAKSDSFFVHLRVGVGGAATLCVLGDRVGVAFCAPTENFSRKIGRAISRGRAESTLGHVFALPPRTQREDGETVVDFVVRIFKAWLDGLPDGVRPQWVDEGCGARKVQFWADDPGTSRMRAPRSPYLRAAH